MKCSVEGCASEAGKRRGMCEKHYMRWYRHGHTDKKVQAKNLAHSSGYVLVPANGHFLARGGSHAYEHRMVYHEHFGGGPFECYWCSVVVGWSDMHIDHIDSDKKNNDISNLVASCPMCNQARGQWKIRARWREKTGILALGRVQTMNEWSSEIGISRQSLIRRLKRMTPDEAVSLPRGRFGPKGKSTRTRDWR